MTQTDFLKVDGITYNVGVFAGVKRQIDFLDKSAVRTEDGVLNRQLIGVYYNYRNIKFGIQTDDNYTDYTNLVAKLSEATEYHTFEIAGDTFVGYVSNVSDEIYLYQNNKAYHKNLQINITCKEPTIT